MVDRIESPAAGRDREQPVPGPGRRQQVRQVMRAKREWEATVDCLPQVICLLDREGRVLRANRALETWGICSLQQAVGRPLRELLGPYLGRTGTLLSDTLQRFASHSGECVRDWESVCSNLHRTLRFHLRRLEGDPDEPEASEMVLVISDVTEQRAAERTLLNYNRELEHKVRERTNRLIATNEELTREIIEHKRDKAALMESKLELHELSSQLIGAQEAERKRIAGELHDSLGQSLSAIKFSMEGLLAHWRQDPAEEALGAQAEQLVRQLRDAVAEVRRISMDLRPSMLDDLGLLPTLEWFLREYRTIYRHISVSASVRLIEDDIPRSLRVTAFRIVQEALNNVAKHARADSVTLALYREERTIALRVRDDGAGFDPQTLQTALRQVGFGLKSMKERAELSGGTLRVHSVPGEGTEVAVHWPVGGGLLEERGELQAADSRQ